MILFLFCLSFHFVYLLYILEDFTYLFIFRQRGREAEREWEKHQCVVASRVPLTGNLAQNPGIEPATLWFKAGTQSTEPQQPGLFCFLDAIVDWYVFIAILLFIFCSLVCSIVYIPLIFVLLNPLTSKPIPPYAPHIWQPLKCSLYQWTEEQKNRRDSVSVLVCLVCF